MGGGGGGGGANKRLGVGIFENSLPRGVCLIMGIGGGAKL